MAITGIGNGCNNVYENIYVSQKNEEVKRVETKETSSAQTGKAKNEENSSVSDYLDYSQDSGHILVKNFLRAEV